MRGGEMAFDAPPEWHVVFKTMEDGRVMGELQHKGESIWIGDADSYEDLMAKASVARSELAWTKVVLEDDDWY